MQTSLQTLTTNSLALIDENNLVNLWSIGPRTNLNISFRFDYKD